MRASCQARTLDLIGSCATAIMATTSSAPKTAGTVTVSSRKIAPSASAPNGITIEMDETVTAGSSRSRTVSVVGPERAAGELRRGQHAEAGEREADSGAEKGRHVLQAQRDDGWVGFLSR